METGNKPHLIVPKKMTVAKDSKGNWVIVLLKNVVEGKCREVTEQRSVFLEGLTGQWK